MRFRTLATAVPLALAGALLVPATSAAAQEVRSYIVVLRDGASPDAAAETARALGAEVSFVYRHALRGYAAQLTPAEHARISADPDVDFVEPDGTVTMDTTQFNPTWGLDRIDQRFRPLSGSYTYNATGSNVVAYIIDTGIRYTHSQFLGRAVPGYDAVSLGGLAQDCNGHGTHVAGTVGGSTYGVAKQVLLIGIRVLDCFGNGTWAGVIAGVDMVTNLHLPGQPAVANMSLGGGFNAAANLAVANSIADGISYSIAAGNWSTDACSVSPASVATAMTLGASDVNDNHAWFSNYGNCVDWYAPGVDVLSAYHTSDSASIFLSGTSMASPHNAGVAALYLQTNPAASPATVHAVLGGFATQNVIAGVPGGFPNNDLLYTNGL